MTAFARASAEESRRIMDEFLNAIFADRPDDPFAERMRTSLPVLPEQPSEQQIDAWIELASLVQDPDFRARVAHMAAEGERCERLPDSAIRMLRRNARARRSSTRPAQPSHRASNQPQ
jgi:hypothetical protein